MAEEKKGLIGSIKDFFSQEEDEDEASYEEEEVSAAESKPVSTFKKESKNSKPADDVKNINIKIIKPGDDKSAITTILDSLKNNQVVVVNFEETRIDIRASFSDAFFGATYVLNANYTKLSESTYVLAPKNVAVSPLIAGIAESSQENKSNNEYFGSF
jgi:FtsZ-interacting cell division protein YlmF